MELHAGATGSCHATGMVSGSAQHLCPSACTGGAQEEAAPAWPPEAAWPPPSPPHFPGDVLPLAWTLSDVALWVAEAVGLPQYRMRFVHSAVNGRLLLSMTDERLQVCAQAGCGTLERTRGSTFLGDMNSLLACSLRRTKAQVTGGRGKPLRICHPDIPCTPNCKLTRAHAAFLALPSNMALRPCTVACSLLVAQETLALPLIPCPAVIGQRSKTKPSFQGGTGHWATPS
jgi:hypothetical protein